MHEFKAQCPICCEEKKFLGADDFWSGRDGLTSPDCAYGGCATRERALAFVIRTEFSDKFLLKAKIHESSPANRGLSWWLSENCQDYVSSGYFPEETLGAVIKGLQNEDLERQTFGGGIFDLVVHLDVLEHLFAPFQALREIYRTLRPGGKCCFSAPTYHDRFNSQQVAFRQPNGKIEIVGEPEYHHNPQVAEGSLVTWRYGYDLPLLISRETNFDVEVRRFQSKRATALGLMTEIYVLWK